MPIHEYSCLNCGFPALYLNIDAGSRLQSSRFNGIPSEILIIGRENRLAGKVIAEDDFLGSSGEEILCPHCEHKELKRLISAFAFSSKDSSGNITSSSAGCSSCTSHNCSSCF